MTNDAINLQAEPRKAGKHWSRSLRRNRQIPAVVYGPKIENLDIALSENQLVKYMKHQYENTIFTLESDNKDINGLKVLKKAVTIHPLSRRPVHVDFFALDLTQTVRVYVEIRFEGKAEGTREGGLLNLVNREVEIECLPTAIPPYLSIDVTPLGVGDSFHVADLQIPDGIELITPTTDTLCTVAIVEEEVAAPVAAAAPVEGAAPAEGAAAAPAAEGDKKDAKKEG